MRYRGFSPLGIKLLASDIRHLSPATIFIVSTANGSNLLASIFLTAMLYWFHFICPPRLPEEFGVTERKTPQEITTLHHPT
jgi:hypothetical protein